jgi:hypothetical protein
VCRPDLQVRRHEKTRTLEGFGDRGMPFKSQAQRRKFAQLLVEGKISNQTYEEWNRETGGKKLPERVKPKAKRVSKRGSKTRTKKR